MTQHHDQPTDRRRVAEQAESGEGFSRREVLRLLGAAGAVAGLDRLMPPRWLAPQATAVEALNSPAAPSELQISNLSFAWGLEPYDQFGRDVVSPSGYYCDGNASFQFVAQTLQVTTATMLSLNTGYAGVIYNTTIGSVPGSLIQYAALDNMSGQITVPLTNSTIAANTMDTVYVRIMQPPETSNVLMKEFIPACGQTTIANLQAEPVTGCLLQNGNNYSCEHTLAFEYAPNGDVDNSSRVQLRFNGQTLIDWEYLSNLGASGAGTGAISFDTLLPAGQQGLLALTVRNTYGFETNTLAIPFSTAACAPGLAPFLYNPGAALQNGPIKIDFNYHDYFNQVSNASLVTAWLGAPNSSPTQLLLNQVPLAGAQAQGAVFPLNASVFKFAPSANCSGLILNDTYGNGCFLVTLPPANASTRTAAEENVMVSFFLSVVNGTGRSNVEAVLFDPLAVSLADFQAAAPAGGLVGALGAAALGAASLWARFRGGEE